ncbi:hypothetical protein [Enterobacter sp. 22466]|uniref:hypothetical protein n=1 Tax=Enterobacter sp. 22466 TaxID=3453924 RepID=UPI003F8445A4
MKGGAQFNTMGFDRVIRKNITALAGIKLKIGIQKGATATGGGLVAEYAAANNFGTKNGRIPSRPFMTYSSDRIADWMETAAFYEVVNGVIAGRFTADMAAKIIGDRAVNITKKTIKDSALYKPNTEYTLNIKRKKKQGDKPLLASESLFRNVKFVRVM